MKMLSIKTEILFEKSRGVHLNAPAHIISGFDPSQ
jgi:hypothetical protein